MGKRPLDVTKNRKKSCDLSHDNWTIKGSVFGHSGVLSFELLWFAQS